MAEEEKDNGQEIEEEKPLSLFDKKMKDLLDELDERLEQIGGDYGPILMEELQNRLEQVVNNFNDEVHDMVAESFNKFRQFRFTKLHLTLAPPLVAVILIIWDTSIAGSIHVN